MEKEGSVEGTGEAGEMRGTGEGLDVQSIANPTTEEVTKKDGATKEGATEHTTISPRGGTTEARTRDGTMPEYTRRSTCGRRTGE